MGWGNFKDDVLGIDDNKTFGIKNDDWDNAGKWLTDPVGQTIDQADKRNWIGEDDAKVWREANMGAQNLIMAGAGIVLAPATGGASLGMTYGVGSGAGLAAINGADFGQAMGAGRMGGMYGAAGGALTFGVGGMASGTGFGAAGTGSGISGLTAGAGSTGITGAAQLGQLAGTMGTYGVAGYGAGRGAGMSHDKAVMFGLGSGFGAYGGVSKYGATGGGTLSGAGSLMTSAGMGGYLANQSGGQPQPDGGGGGGGNYQAPTSGGNGTAGTRSQSKATKSVPEAQFLDGGGSNWGNAGVGGVFGGLDNLRNKDKYINTDEISRLNAQRGVGAFLK